MPHCTRFPFAFLFSVTMGFFMGSLEVWMQLEQRFLSAKETARYVGISRSTLFRWEANGQFPARRRLGPGRVAWDRHELEIWASEAEPVERAG